MTSHRAKSSTRRQLNAQICLEKTSCDVEISLYWRVVVQDRQPEDDSICKSCLEEGVLWRRIRRKVTSRRSKMSTRRLNVQGCHEKDVMWRRIKFILTSRRARSSTRGPLNTKIVLKKTSRDVELDEKWRVVAQELSTRGRLNAQLCLEKDVLKRKKLQTNYMSYLKITSWVSGYFAVSSLPVMSHSQLGTNQSLHESWRHHFRLFTKYDISHDSDLLPVPWLNLATFGIQ